MQVTTMTATPDDQIQAALAALAARDEEITTEDLLAEIGELDMGAIEEEPVEEEPVEDVTDELDEDALAAIQMGQLQAEVYQSQPAGVSPADPATMAAVTAQKPAKAPRQPKASKPRIERDLSALPAETFLLHDADTDADAMKVEVLANPPKQTKVVEKFENLFISLHNGTAPSKFTVTGFRLLKANGSMTTTDLVAAMRAEGAGDGTARAQAGQIMALLPLLGIATRSGQLCALRADSVIAKKLSTILGL